MSGSFEEAVSLLDEEASPDLLLLDLNMPGSKGVTGLTQIRARYPAVPVIVVSATEDTATIRKSIALGASGYVPKSSGLEDIRKAVTAVLGGDSSATLLWDHGCFGIMAALGSWHHGWGGRLARRVRFSRRAGRPPHPEKSALIWSRQSRGRLAAPEGLLCRRKPGQNVTHSCSSPSGVRASSTSSSFCT